MTSTDAFVSKDSERLQHAAFRNSAEVNSSTCRTLNLDIDEDFFDSLTDKGLKVWYNSDFQDFMYELQIVGGEQQEIKKLLKLYNRFPWWFNRCYSKVHENLAQYFESEGRNFK